jgi:low temperature requirement protein LtrA
VSPTRRAWQRPALRTDEQFELHRAVSWLELFFDLVFVVVISRLAHQLAVHSDPAGLAQFAVQFLAIFWVWNAFTYYTERFESDGLENRLFTFLAIVPVAGLAMFAENGLGTHYPGFAIAYLLARAVNMLGWARAGAHVPVFRPVMRRFLAGFGLATLLIATSFAVGPPSRLVLFGLAVLVEICTPSLTVTQQSALPPLSTSKFPERFGLLTMIVLGESVVGVINGGSTLADHGLTTPGIVSGVLGLAIGFGLWWLYFDFIARRAPRPVFLTALLWVYLHMALLIGIVTVGAGISLALTTTSDGELNPTARHLLVAGVVLGLLAVAALQLTLHRAPDEPTHPQLSPGLKAGIAVLLGSLGSLDLGWTTPALLGTVLAGLCLPMAYGSYVWFTKTTTDTGSPA